MVITVKKVIKEEIDVDGILATLKGSVDGAKDAGSENVIIKCETAESAINIIQKFKENAEKTNCSSVHRAMTEDFLRSSFL